MRGLLDKNQCKVLFRYKNNNNISLWIFQGDTEIWSFRNVRWTILLQLSIIILSRGCPKLLFLDYVTLNRAYISPSYTSCSTNTANTKIRLAIPLSHLTPFSSVWQIYRNMFSSRWYVLSRKIFSRNVSAVSLVFQSFYVSCYVLYFTGIKFAHIGSYLIQRTFGWYILYL